MRTPRNSMSRSHCRPMAVLGSSAHDRHTSLARATMHSETCCCGALLHKWQQGQSRARPRRQAALDGGKEFGGRAKVLTEAHTPAAAEERIRHAPKIASALKDTRMHPPPDPPNDVQRDAQHAAAQRHCLAVAGLQRIHQLAVHLLHLGEALPGCSPDMQSLDGLPTAAPSRMHLQALATTCLQVFPGLPCGVL